MQYEGCVYDPSKCVNFLHAMLLALSKSFTILLFDKNTTKHPRNLR